MKDKQVFREVFNFFVKYRDMLDHMNREAFWMSAAKELGRIGAVLGNTDFAHDLLIAVYSELERRESSGER